MRMFWSQLFVFAHSSLGTLPAFTLPPPAPPAAGRFLLLGKLFARIFLGSRQFDLRTNLFLPWGTRLLSLSVPFTLSLGFAALFHPLRQIVRQPVQGSASFSAPFGSFSPISSCTSTFNSVYLRSRRFRPNFFLVRSHLLEPAKYPVQQGGGLFGLGRDFLLANGRGLGRNNSSHGRLLPYRLGFLSGRGKQDLLRGLLHSLITRLNVCQFNVIMTKPIDAVVRRFKVDIGDQDDVDFQTRFNGMDFRSLFVQQIR